MAREARRRKVPEPEPSALAHRAFRATPGRGRATRRPLRSLIGRSRSFFPAAADDRAAARSEPGPVGGPVCRRPGRGLSLGARRRPQGARPPALGRRRSSGCMELEPIPDLAAAHRACRSRPPSLLPEKPDLPARLLEKAVAAARRRARPPCGSTRSRPWPKSTASGCDGPTRPRRSSATGSRSSGPGSATTDAEGRGRPGRPLRGDAPGPRHGRRVAA